MTSDDFRRIALSFPGAMENTHMNHPDFRANGKIFATLHYPDAEWAMVKLPVEQQAAFLEMDPGAFVPVKGAWGKQGATSVRLRAVKQEAMQGALEMAWQKTTEKKKRR